MGSGSKIGGTVICFIKRQSFNINTRQYFSKAENSFFNQCQNNTNIFSAKFSSTPKSQKTALSGNLGFKYQICNLLKEYKQLSKAKLSLLVVGTACAGFVVGSGNQINFEKLGWTALGTFGAAACANTLNQIYEIKRDALMRRTFKRPLPSKRITPLHALIFACVMGISGISILYTQLNQLTAALGFSNIILYACIYTPLKVVTVANTWVGAIVGAIPPVMGWTAACNRIDPAALVPAAILFFWQIPHFLALAWMAREDYAVAGYKMLTTLDGLKLKPGPVCIRNSFYLMPLGLASVGMGLTGQWFIVSNGLLSLLLAYGAMKFSMKPGISSARMLFKGSLIFLPLSMTALMFHRIPNEGQQCNWQDLFNKLESFFLWNQTLMVHLNLKPLQQALGSYFVECPSKVLCDDEESKKNDHKNEDENLPTQK